jgi:hypothetical protein
MDRLLTVMLLASVCGGIHPPPVGASYHKTLSFPLLGHQSVSLHILSRDRATIHMDGIITHAESLDYAFNFKTSDVTFTLSDAVEQRLNTYKCRIQSAWYDSEHDEACITLRLKLLHFNKIVRMSCLLSDVATKCENVDQYPRVEPSNSSSVENDGCCRFYKGIPAGLSAVELEGLSYC